MPRDKTPPPDTTGEVPMWFMTYSDVITLLMTFFILLLTFASQEPEKFERMKSTMFGGGGSAGVAGSKDDALDRESIVMRYRPRSSRLTQRGSEVPPKDVDISTSGPDYGLKSLDDRNELAKLERVNFEASRDSMLTPDGELTSLGKQRLVMFAKQAKRLSLQLSIRVPQESDLPMAVEMAHYMTFEQGVPTGKVAVGRNWDSSTISFTMTKEK